MSADPPAQPDLTGRDFERILLVKPSSLGDIVHALPVLHGLRIRYPGAKIDWLIASTFAPLLDGHPELNELILFDRARYGRVARSWSATKGFGSFLRGLKQARYDLVIDLQGLFRTGFMSWATGAGVRLGLGGAREGARFFYTHKLITPDPDAHAVDRNFLVASCLGFGDVPIRFDLALSEAEREEAQRTCREAGLDSERPIVAVLPGARWETKLWPHERFAEAIDRLMIEDGVSCVLLGSESEASLCANIASRCSADPVDLSGQTTLRQMAALLGVMDLVLCHDSAPMHVAVALERPIVCITGPTNPKRTGPYRRQEDVVRLELQCSPCYFRRLSQCPHRHRCMAELTNEEVLEACRRALSSASCSQF